MQIRYAVPGDSAALANIQIMSYRTAYAGILPDPYLAHFTHEEETADWQHLLTNPTKDILYVAEGRNELVGYALGRPNVMTNERDIGELVALHVLPDFQRSGIGRQLFLAITNNLRLRGSVALILWTLAANPVRRWYEQLDGQLAGEQHLDIDGVEVIEVAYKWPNIDELCTYLTK